MYLSILGKTTAVHSDQSQVAFDKRDFEDLKPSPPKKNLIISKQALAAMATMAWLGSFFEGSRIVGHLLSETMWTKGPQRRPTTAAKGQRWLRPYEHCRCAKAFDLDTLIPWVAG